MNKEAIIKILEKTPMRCGSTCRGHPRLRNADEIAENMLLFFPEGICRDCALAEGAKGIEGHLSSYWDGTCKVCKVIKSVNATTDWLWTNETS